MPLASASALTAAMTILVPIAIFWFLSLLVWRAQELRLMASAMTEVAVRLAEPDKLAEQSVASLGQTIRRQVAAMNDAISRAIGRASELEALVHNEVAALERSYSENEVRVRGLISELASEREALANNSQRVSEALKGVGAQVAKDISAASGSIDKKLAERGLQLTELLVARSNEAADQVQKAQAKVAEHVPGLLDRLTKEQTRLSQVIEGAAKNLSALETVVGERANALDKTLKERTEALTASLATRIKGAGDRRRPRRAGARQDLERSHRCVYRRGVAKRRRARQGPEGPHRRLHRSDRAECRRTRQDAEGAHRAFAQTIGHSTDAAERQDFATSSDRSSRSDRSIRARSRSTRRVAERARLRVLPSPSA